MSPPNPPSSVLPYMQQAAAGTGLPLSVVEAQNYNESAYGSNMGPSSAGALGPWQFIPSTYTSPPVSQSLSTIEQWGPSTQGYISYMNYLLQLEGGNIFDALAAYNGGPGNIQAGYGYASTIESQAGISQSTTAGPKGATSGLQPNGGTTPAQTTGFNPGQWIANLFGLGGVFNAATDPIGTFLGDIASAFGISKFSDLVQRAALILFGAVLIIVGLAMLEKRSIQNALTITSPPPPPRETKPAPSESTNPGGVTNQPKTTTGKASKAATNAGESLGAGTGSLASEAVDAAIVA